MCVRASATDSSHATLEKEGGKTGGREGGQEEGREGGWEEGREGF